MHYIYTSLLLWPAYHLLEHILMQARWILFEFHKREACHTYIKLDGELSKQPLCEDSDSVIVIFDHLGRLNMFGIISLRECMIPQLLQPRGVNNDYNSSIEHSTRSGKRWSLELLTSLDLLSILTLLISVNDITYLLYCDHSYKCVHVVSLVIIVL